MTTRGQINSNFYQIVNVDSDGNPTSVKSEFVTDVAHANTANTVTTAAQPNITSLGTLANLTSTGNITAPFFIGNVVGNISGNIVVPGTNTSVLFNNDGNAGASDNLQFDSSTNILKVVGNVSSVNANLGNLAVANYFSGSGNLLANIQVGNITGLGNIATINLNGNGSQVLAGNGAWVAQGGTSDANYANFAGNVVNASQPNITSLGTLLNLSVTGNVTSGHLIGEGGNISNITAANITGTVTNATHATVSDSANSVSVGNVSGIGNIATINLDGSAGNVLYGNGVWAAVSATNANYANFAGNVTISAQPNITSVGNLVSLQMNNTVTPITPNVGQMFWDTSEHTVTLGMENGVMQQVGLENYIYAKADSTITNGQVVMMTGANGNNVTIAPADVTSVGFVTQQVLGIATQDIATNGFGYITTFGKVHGLNTNSFNVGDILWLSTTTPGEMTNVRPVDPNYQVQVATVTKKAGGDGHVQVLIYPFTPLTKLTDVETTSPANGQALVFNSTSNVWINGNPQQANIANVANSVAGGNVTGQVANALVAGTVYTNAQPNITSTGTLVSLTVSGVTNLGSVGNINISGGSSGQVLSTNGSGNLSWVAQSGGGGSTGFEQTFLLMGA